jgi:hypothetical protein
MKISSPDFSDSNMIPSKYTCQGDDVNPELVIKDCPEGTKTTALIVDDPDAPIGNWVHWVLYNMPPNPQIEEDSVPGEQGMNNFGRKDYGGPCPPSGTHRYFFKSYALDARLKLPEGAGKKDLESAMEGHILDRATLIGLYKKQ